MNLFQKSDHSSVGVRKNIMSDEDLLEEEFKTVSKILTNYIEDKSTSEVSQWFEKVLSYNLPHGKRNRGLCVIKTFNYLVPDVAEEEKRLAAILGWCIEMCQAHFLMLDDVMDQSSTRRGVPCWYRREEVGLMAVNDAILVEHSIYLLLRLFLKNHPNYTDFSDVFHEIILYTCCGQCLDMMSIKSVASAEWAWFSEETRSNIVRLKTAYYTFCLPVRMALILASQGELYTREVEALLFAVGDFFQVQDDFIDCFGDPSVTGKQGTDIEEGKCSWIIITALRHVNQDDKLILQENYGSGKPGSVEKVMAIFNKVGIPGLYEKYEKDTYNSICQQIEALNLTCKIPAQVFYGLLNKVYKRSK